MPGRSTARADSLPPWLVALLVCPVDRAAVRIEDMTLVCTLCRRRYPVRDGIPVMIPNDEGEHQF